MGSQGIGGIDLSPESLEMMNRWSEVPQIPQEKPDPMLPEQQDPGRAEPPDFTSQVQPVPVHRDDMARVRDDIRVCSRCPLSGSGARALAGEGNPEARLVFVVEMPNEDEERAGKPLEGPAGQLLAKIIDAMGLSPDDVFICYLLKCRPQTSRRPGSDEIQACLPFLNRQLEVIKPDFICALGQTVAQALIGTDQPITRLRGNFHDFRGMRVMPTFHPAFLLRNPSRKREVWEDMKTLMRAMGPPPSSGG